MPVHKIEVDHKNAGWAIWHITESESELTASEACPDDITNVIKRREWLAGRALMRMLADRLGIIYQGIYKDDFGKPYLSGNTSHVSLSHSFPYVAAQINKDIAVGTDIEQPKAKLLKIAPRIFSAEELIDAGDSLIKNCIYWCGKESLYKIYGQRGLSFIEHLRIDPFTAGNAGVIGGNISIDGKIIHCELTYQVEPDYVLVRTLNTQVASV